MGGNSVRLEKVLVRETSHAMQHARKAGMASQSIMAVGNENVLLAGIVARVKFHGRREANLHIGGQFLC
jgi:hypothetical protein